MMDDGPYHLPIIRTFYCDPPYVLRNEFLYPAGITARPDARSGSTGVREAADCGCKGAEAGLARDMLAAGVVVAAFEARFEREGGVVSDDFHAQWEIAVGKWWELAEHYERLEPRGEADEPVAHAASVVRMVKLPQGLVF